MTFTEYRNYFESIVQSSDPAAPYNNPDYMNYTKLNWNRSNRWLKNGTINPELKQVIIQITTAQTWLIIAEPWCGDAAHSVPFMQLLAELNPLIATQYELRDAPPYTIEKYLTNGKSKSIPVLVIRDENGKDIFKWGPRPEPAQIIHDELTAKTTDFEVVHVALQQWYNEDKGQKMQQELLALFRNSQM